MYQALYRKYRSKTFDEVVGQNNIINALKNQINNSEISHAYLFSGTRGTGKTSCAKIFARAVNCLNPKDGNPCNECENCKSILEDRVMDVVEMDAASNNGVDDIRELKDKVIYAPQNLKYKVYIIDEVHMLSKGAFNALLKILEEPPTHLIFILATTEPEKIPQTILSRTQRFNFKRISNEIIKNNLKRISELENRKCEEKVFDLIANNSDGAMRDALSLLDQCISYGDMEITYKLATDILSISSEETIFNLSGAIIDRNLDKCLNRLEEVYSLGKDINILITDLISHFRNLMIVKTIPNPEDLLFTSMIKEYNNEATDLEIDRILEILKILNETLVSVKYAQDKRVIFEMCLVKLISIEDKKSLLKRIEHLEKVISGGINISSNLKTISKKSSVEEISDNNSKEIENSTNSSTFINDESSKLESVSEIDNSDKSGIINSEDLSNEIGLSTEKLRSDWNNILYEIKNRKRITVSVLLSSMANARFSNNTIIIEYDLANKMKHNLISSEENLEFLKDFFYKYYNANLDVKINLIGEKEANRAIEKANQLFGKENINKI